MNKDIIEFMKNLDIKEEVSKYKDDKGNILYIPTNTLFPTCSYLTLTEEEYQQALFKGQVKKGDYKKTKEKRPVPKNTITNKEEDKLTIVDKEVEVYQIWVVANPYGFSHSFNNKEEAIKFVESIEELL
jgi:hypothetical protein